MAKIALVGAGSATFSRRLLGDLLSWPEFQDADFRLMDVDTERLDLIEALAKKMVEAKGASATITATTDRKQALDGADYVITTLAIGYAYQTDRPDVAIPRKYDLHQTVADTIGVGGVFRYLRTMPAMLEIGQDMQRLCPQALWLNYVNPMNMIMWTINLATPSIRNVGLCHSVQGTADRLAGFVGVEKDDLSYWVAGINHQAWFLELKRNTYRGEDLYPKLREAMDVPETYEKDRVRFEVLRHFGYFVTESSRHMSEYVPWFRRTEADRERYTPSTSMPEWMRTERQGQQAQGALAAVPQRHAEVWETIKKQIAGEAPIDYKLSREYCSYIMHAVETNAPFRFNGNVQNTGLITNLPPNCNVEVPIMVDNTGLRPCYVGDLPSQLAGINRTNVNVQELAVKGFLDRDREAIHQACALDPLAASVVNLPDMRKMVDELFEANSRWLDGYDAKAPAGAGSSVNGSAGANGAATPVLAGAGSTGAR
jgi:alpha-galactosidase